MRYFLKRWPNSFIGRRISDRVRRTSFNDSIYRDILNSFFGDEVFHVTHLGTVEAIGLTKYLSTHFNLCTGPPEPI